VKFWFHNHTRASLSGSGVRGVLKLAATSKLVQPWQAYLNKFQDTKLKCNIEDAWKYYLYDAKARKPEKTKFEIQNRVAQGLYEDETDDVKQEVEEHYQKMRHSRIMPDTTDRNKVFQRY
jgi:hypothetical protein